MSPAARARYLYQRTGIHPHQDSPGEAADKIVTVLSLGNPLAGGGRLATSTVARHILPKAVLKASQAFRGKAARGTARLTEHLLARRADDVFPGHRPEKPPGTDTHHIVPKGEYVNRSEKARDALHHAQGKLDDLGIDPDNAANGVFLDRDLHRGIHTNSYFQELNKRLGKATSRTEARTGPAPDRGGGETWKVPPQEVNARQSRERSMSWGLTPTTMPIWPPTDPTRATG